MYKNTEKIEKIKKIFSNKFIEIKQEKILSKTTHIHIYNVYIYNVTYEIKTISNTEYYSIINIFYIVGQNLHKMSINPNFIDLNSITKMKKTIIQEIYTETKYKIVNNNYLSFCSIKEKNMKHNLSMRVF